MDVFSCHMRVRSNQRHRHVSSTVLGHSVVWPWWSNVTNCCHCLPNKHSVSLWWLPRKTFRASRHKAFSGELTCPFSTSSVHEPVLLRKQKQKHTALVFCHQLRWLHKVTILPQMWSSLCTGLAPGHLFLRHRMLLFSSRVPHICVELIRFFSCLIDEILCLNTIFIKRRLTQHVGVFHCRFVLHSHSSTQSNRESPNIQSVIQQRTETNFIFMGLLKGVIGDFQQKFWKISRSNIKTLFQISSQLKMQLVILG